MDGFAETREAQLAADYDLLTAVMFESFDGPAWDKMSERLVAYGLVVIKSWLRRGVIFGRCAEKGWGIRHAMHEGIDDIDDRTALAEETVWRAVLGYRDKVLIPGKWDPRKGANLTTYFTGQCLFQFRNVYKKWWHETYGPHGKEPDVPLDDNMPEHPTDRSIREHSPAGTAITRTRIHEGLEHADPTDLEILAWYADGYSYAEIAELTSIDLSNIKIRMHRLRKKANIHDAA